MLKIQYLRDKKNNPIGVVIAIAPGIVGWSLCNKNDLFSKDLAKHIALERADKALVKTESEREKYYESVPNSIFNLFAHVYQKSLFVKDEK